MGEAIVKHISWVPQNQQIIGYRYPERDIPTNSILEVKPGQVAILVQYSAEGSATKTFPAGRYQLETSLPVGEKKGFFRRMFSKATGTNIYQCDIYFFLAKTNFAKLEWSTKQGPINCGYVDFKILKGDSDAEAEATTQINITLKGGGTYGAHLIFDEFDDPDTIKTIVENIMSNRDILTTNYVEEIMNSRIIQNISNAFGDLVNEVNSDIFNLGKYFDRLSSVMTARVTPILKEYGITLDFFAIDRLNYPDDVKAEIKEYEQMRKERIAEYNKTMAEIKKERYRNLADFEKRHYENIADDEMRRTYGYMQEKQIDVMKAAASNEGMSGTFMGAGMGLGMGVGMGNVFGAGMNSMAQGAMGNAPQMGMAPMGAPQQAAPQETCPQCGAVKQPNSNFCNSCGHAFGIKCPDCGTMLPTGMKFCGNCGHAFELKCPSCGTTLPVGTKFCGNCGTKL